MKRMIDSELIEALGTDIKFDGKGNVIVGKNLEVGGTTKLNGGLKVISEHKFSTLDGTEWSVLDYGTLNDSYNNIFTLKNDQGDWYIGIGTFDISESGELIRLFALSTIDNEIEYISYNSLEDTDVNYKTVPFIEDIQPKLYRHVITLHANSTSDGSCRLEYISPKDLVCDSLEDLRTVLGNPPMQSYIASNPSGDLFGVVISPSTAQIKKVGTTSLLNITSVSDTVTAL